MASLLFKKLRFFQDLATSLRLGTVKADKRIQVKMPDIVVQELDKQFPKVDRSRLLTQLVVDLLTQRLHFQDRQVLRDLAASEQGQLDALWSYLEDRDAKGAKNRT